MGCDAVVLSLNSPCPPAVGRKTERDNILCASLSGTLLPTAHLTGIISTFVNNKHLPPLLMAKMKTGCAVLVACALLVGTSLVSPNVLFTNTLEVIALEIRRSKAGHME